jgi:prepilin-type processing-associated H-X9-DG protein
VFSFDAEAKAYFFKSAFVCPDYKPRGIPLNPYVSGIAESGFLVSVTPGPNDATRPRRIASMRRPASTLIHIADSFQDYVLKDNITLKNGGRSFDIYRHNRNKAANVLFLDGHAGTFRSDYILKYLTVQAPYAQAKMTLQ